MATDGKYTDDYHSATMALNAVWLMSQPQAAIDKKDNKKNALLLMSKFPPARWKIKNAL